MYKIYKTTQGKLTNPEKVSELCWIDLNSPTQNDLDELKSIIDIPEDVIVSIRDTDEVPKVEKYDDFNFILVQTPLIHREDEEDEDSEATYNVAPLGIIYTSKFIITISEGRNDIINYLRAKLKNYANNRIIDTDRIPQFILKLLLFSAKMYLRYLKNINQKIRSAQTHLEKSPQNEEIIDLMNLEKSLVYFSTSLHSNRIVFDKLAKRKFFTEDEDDEELIEDVLDESKQSLEMVKIYGKIVGNISSTFAAIVSNNLNQTVKFLTSVTIILMIPTLVASVYGMNVAIPFQNSPHAFLIAIVISVLSALLGVIVFFRKKLF